MPHAKNPFVLSGLTWKQKASKKVKSINLSNVFKKSKKASSSDRKKSIFKVGKVVKF